MGGASLPAKDRDEGFLLNLFVIVGQGEESKEIGSEEAGKPRDTVREWAGGMGRSGGNTVLLGQVHILTCRVEVFPCVVLEGCLFQRRGKEVTTSTVW